MRRLISDILFVLICIALLPMLMVDNCGEEHE